MYGYAGCALKGTLEREYKLQAFGVDVHAASSMNLLIKGDRLNVLFLASLAESTCM